MVRIMKYHVATIVLFTLCTDPVSAQGPVPVRVIGQSPDILTRHDEQLHRLGNPADWTSSDSLAGIGDTLRGLSAESVIIETAEFLDVGVRGDRVIGYDAGGLFDPIPGEVFTDEDEFVELDMWQFRPNELTILTVSNVLETTTNARERKQAIREAMQKTINGVRESTTQAQTQKLAPILTAQSAELLSIDNETDTANDQLLVQSILIENYQDMIAKIEREERIANMETAVRRIREFLSVENVAFRQPKQRKFP